eukprot:6212020-Pleurochrysis_carterae.AAC.2
MDNKPFSSITAQKDYCRLIAHRIQSLIKRLKTFHQSRQHGAYTTQHIHTSMENALHSLGLFNPHSGSFQLSSDIQQLLSLHDPLSDIEPSSSAGGRAVGRGQFVTLMVFTLVDVGHLELSQDEIYCAGSSTPTCSSPGAVYAPLRTLLAAAASASQRNSA